MSSLARYPLRKVGPREWAYGDWQMIGHVRSGKWAIDFDCDGYTGSTRFAYDDPSTALEAAMRMANKVEDNPPRGWRQNSMSVYDLIDNPRRSRVKDALSDEARKYKSFEDFEQHYWRNAGRGIFWIATRDPEFKIGPKEIQDAAQGKLILYTSPFEALKGVNATKPFVAEIELLGRAQEGVDYEHIEPRPDEPDTSTSIRLINTSAASTYRVIPADKARRVHVYQRGLLPVSRQELLDAWLIARSPDSDVRRKHRRRRRTEEEEAAERELLQLRQSLNPYRSSNADREVFMISGRTLTDDQPAKGMVFAQPGRSGFTVWKVGPGGGLAQIDADVFESEDPDEPTETMLKWAWSGLQGSDFRWRVEDIESARKGNPAGMPNPRVSASRARQILSKYMKGK